MLVKYIIIHYLSLIQPNCQGEKWPFLETGKFIILTFQMLHVIVIYVECQHFKNMLIINIPN